MLKISIILLTFITSAIHIIIGLHSKESILILNGIGYLAFLLALYQTTINLPKKTITILFILYTILTITLYFIDHNPFTDVHAHNDSNSTPPTTRTHINTPDQPHTQNTFDLLGLSTKITEIILILLLLKHYAESNKHSQNAKLSP